MCNHGPEPPDARPVEQPTIPFGVPVFPARPVSAPVESRPGRGPMYLDYASRRSVWADIGALILFAVASDLLLGAAAGVVLDLNEGLDERKVLMAVLPFRGAAWVVIVGVLLKARGQRWASVGLTRGWLAVDVPLGLVALAGGFAAFAVGTLALYVFWREGYLLLTENDSAIAEMLPRTHLVLLVGLQVIVGFYEELIFRGFLLTRLRRGLGSWILAVVLSSALFAAPHAYDQTPPAVVPIFFLGVVFCILTIWRKSLLPAMIGHALFNSSQLVVLFYYMPDWT